MKHYIEPAILKFLQSKVTFAIDKKIVKSGKLILFNIKDFYMNFTLKDSNNTIKHYSLPYPFAVEQLNENTLQLGYNLELLSRNNHELYYKIKVLSKHKNSKLYNSVVTISKQ